MDIEELKRLAEAANKAYGGLPWQVTMARSEHGVTHYRVRGHCEAAIAVDKDQYWEEGYVPPIDFYGYIQPDERMDCDQARVDIARHVAAANPAAILELIQQRDELLAALKRIKANLMHQRLCGQSAGLLHAAIQAEGDAEEVIAKMEG